MQPGELVLIKVSCYSTDGKLFECGDVGLVMDSPNAPYINLLIKGEVVDFHPRMLDRIELPDETR